METGTSILIGAIAVFVTAITVGFIQVRRMRLQLKKEVEHIIRDVETMVPKKSIYEQLEETLAERKRIIELLDKK